MSTTEDFKEEVSNCAKVEDGDAVDTNNNNNKRDSAADDYAEGGNEGNKKLKTEPRNENTADDNNKNDDDDADSSHDLVQPGTEGISKIEDNDVLSGRGGGTNLHPGNRQFRDLINLYRRDYLKARKNDKPAISRSIVNSIREKNGRFLKKVEKTGLWYEIGDDAAREKTSQALRQRAPEMRKLLLDHEMEGARVQQQQMMMGMSAGMMNPAAAMMNPAAAMMGMPMLMPNGQMAAFNPAMMQFNPGAMMQFNPLMMGVQQPQTNAAPGAAPGTDPPANQHPMMMMMQGMPGTVPQQQPQPQQQQQQQQANGTRETVDGRAPQQQQQQHQLNTGGTATEGGDFAHGANTAMTHTGTGGEGGMQTTSGNGSSNDAQSFNNSNNNNSNNMSVMTNTPMMGMTNAANPSME